MNLTKSIFLFATILIVSANRDRIRLKDVETLTLYADSWTTSRRIAPVKQLACIGGYCNNKIIPQTAQCYNRGFDGRDVQWECKGDLPSNYKFGRLGVACEGYDYADDDYILVGSCGLEYTVEEVSKSNSHYSSSQNVSNDTKGDGTYMMTIIVVIGAAVALYFYLRPKKTSSTPNANSQSSSSNSNPSAPPPYGFRSDYFKTNDESYNSAGTSSGTSAGTSAGVGTGPGFFSGMATGGFLGYLFGSNRSNTGYARRGYQDASFWSNPSSTGYSSFGRPSYSSASSSTSKTRTATGFASTKRR